MTCSQGLSAAVPACFDDICYQCARVMRFKRAAMASLKGLSSVDPAYFYTLSYQVVLECCSSVVLSSSNFRAYALPKLPHIPLQTHRRHPYMFPHNSCNSYCERQLCVLDFRRSAMTYLQGLRANISAFCKHENPVLKNLRMTAAREPSKCSTLDMQYYKSAGISTGQAANPSAAQRINTT